MRRSVKRANKGKIQNATRALGVNGLQFRSKLELFTYTKLLEAGIKDFKYEEDKFILLEPFEFKNESIEAYERTVEGGKVKIFGDVNKSIRSISYLPDFTCIKEDKTGWVLEVKGYNNDAFPNKWKYFKEHLMKNNYNIDLYKPNTQGNVLKCIEMIKKKYYESQ